MISNSSYHHFRVMGEISIPVASLANDYEPYFSNNYKEKVWQHAKMVHSEKLQDGSLGNITVRRACVDDAINLTIHSFFNTDILNVPYFFDYEQSTESNTTWYLNFADPTLFVAYSGSLFAQDEIQTLEHPLLPSVRSYISSNHIPDMAIYTVEGRKPTPYLFKNVPNMVEINTTPTMPDGRKISIYGNAFSQYGYREPLVLDKAITIRKEIIKSNIIAMAAPLPGYGSYEKAEILNMLETVIASFNNAKDMSTPSATEIHTGRWGAGAFGGNEELALTVQIIGARATNIDKLVFHAVTASCLSKAITTADSICKNTEMSIGDIVDILYKKEFQWGHSDGN